MDPNSGRLAANVERALLDPLLRAEMERVLASAQFSSAERLQRFLRFIVEAVLEGKTAHLKESVIGVQVFDLDIGFDPKIDPVVRVTARRLREKLEQFYAAAPAGSGLMIQLPKGSYIPEIVPKAAEIEEFAPPETAQPVSAAPPVPWRARRPWVAACAAVLLPAAVALAWKFWPDTPKTFTGPVSRFTINLPDDQLLLQWYGNDLAFSPDGKTLVYAARRNGVQQLFLRSLNQQESRVIPDSENAVAPFFSPGGESVVAFAPQKLRRFTLSGGYTDLARISPILTVYGGLWDAGEGLLFNDCPPAVVKEGSSFVYRLPRGRGAPAARMTWPLDAREPEAQMIQQVLPGGKDWLVSINGPTFFLSAISLRGGTRTMKMLLPDARGGMYLPTGHLVFWRDGNLMAAPFSLRRMELTGPPVAAVRDVGFSGWQGAEAAVSRDGTLAYVNRGSPVPDRSLVWVDLSGHETPLPIPPGPMEPMDLSPSGRNLLLARYDAHAASWTLWNYSLKDGSSIQLSEPSRFRPYACWSPDGRAVVYSSPMESGNETDLFLKPADGMGVARRIAHPAHYGDVPQAWSPDGKWLVYVHGMVPATKSDIWVMPMDSSGEPRPLVLTPGYDKVPTLSADGRWMAYVTEGRILIQRFPDAGGQAPISVADGDAPMWSPSGRKLYFLHGERVLAVDLDLRGSPRAGSPVTLFSGKYMATGIWHRSAILAPDGKRFLLVREALEPGEGKRINVVTNWYAEITSLFRPSGS